METYLPLIALIGWAVASLGVAYLLDHAQHVSRSVPVLKPWYQSDYRRRHTR